MNLFIIGNGFDIGHKLPTHYWDFRIFLEEHHPIFLNDFEEKYFLWGKELETLLWNDFEFNLANIQEDTLFEQMYQSTDLGLDSGNVGIEDTLRHHFREEFNYINKLTIYLKEWIEEVSQKLDGTNKRTSFIKENSLDIFINFNYTTTLEEVYSIKNDKVLHIHGVVNSDDNLVLGHSNEDRIAYFNKKCREYQNIGDEQSAPIYNILAEYCSRTYKDVQENIPLLWSLDNDPIEKIMIIGHSLSTVDLPYFKAIKEITGEDVEWNIYYYDENATDMFRERLKLIGVDEQQIHMIPSSEFYDLPIVDQISLKL
ncbi:bacteriophage abortive infection AbiH family protein [Lysinibacillus xylanilyticus]|uniref:bacteriophage abortive infection AbiH family protein n=1 Tax=Lysinibacillus xylanilyticus TaxID=582475 RepID=UPI002B247179|nr:bacteriophage abortive infection AbiH family protein [Lysinibacillus xylanilyticus]MEB2282378.1 bacteriophage abortive infection AbiH family protein [Lysinibacillus xylanilyticus]